MIIKTFDEIAKIDSLEELTSLLNETEETIYESENDSNSDHDYIETLKEYYHELEHNIELLTKELESETAEIESHRFH